MSGEFDLYINGQVLFYKRMLVIFLRLLEAPGETRGSRRTRDGRTPAVRQQELEQKLDVPQPHISLWMKYWHTQDWRRLLSRKTSDVLTLEVQQRVIETWVQFPWWGVGTPESTGRKDFPQPGTTSGAREWVVGIARKLAPRVCHQCGVLPTAR